MPYKYITFHYWAELEPWTKLIEEGLFHFTWNTEVKGMWYLQVQLGLRKSWKLWKIFTEFDLGWDKIKLLVSFFRTMALKKIYIRFELYKLQVNVFKNINVLKVLYTLIKFNSFMNWYYLFIYWFIHSLINLTKFWKNLFNSKFI